jgi:hypothetical protein
VLIAAIATAGSAVVAITALILGYRGFASIDSRFSSIDARFSSLERRLDAIQADLKATSCLRNTTNASCGLRIKRN